MLGITHVQRYVFNHVGQIISYSIIQSTVRVLTLGVCVKRIQLFK